MHGTLRTPSNYTTHQAPLLTALFRVGWRAICTLQRLWLHMQDSSRFFPLPTARHETRSQHEQNTSFLAVTGRTQAIGHWRPRKNDNCPLWNKRLFLRKSVMFSVAASFWRYPLTHTLGRRKTDLVCWQGQSRRPDSNIKETSRICATSGSGRSPPFWRKGSGVGPRLPPQSHLESATEFFGWPSLRAVSDHHRLKHRSNSVQLEPAKSSMRQKKTKTKTKKTKKKKNRENGVLAPSALRMFRLHWQILNLDLSYAFNNWFAQKKRRFFKSESHDGQSQWHQHRLQIYISSSKLPRLMDGISSTWIWQATSRMICTTKPPLTVHASLSTQSQSLVFAALPVFGYSVTLLFR